MNVTHQRRKAMGLCVLCGRTAPTEGKTQCRPCAARTAAYTRERKVRLGSAHRCTRCAEELPSAHRFKTCDSCRTYESRYRDDWAARNRDRVLARYRERAQAARLECLRAYGGQCACCGETEPVFLTIDHVDDGGAEHRRTMRRVIYFWLIKQAFPAGFQVLCANCNMGRFWNRANGGCPHRFRAP